MLNLKTLNETLYKNRVNADEYQMLVSASQMKSWDDSGMLELSPLYQRPYTKRDGQKGYYGDAWQKSLIADFFKGRFIQPIHHRKNSITNKREKIDGGHRTRTILNFLRNLLKTPTGFELDYDGETYDLGNMFYSEIQTINPDLAQHMIDTNYFFVIEYLNMDDKKARRKFLTLNNLHNMKDAEKRNAHSGEVARLCRHFGAVDFSPFEIFKTFNGGKMKYISLKSINRETDAFVTALALILKEKDNWKDGTNQKWNSLYSDDESLGDKSPFKLNGKIGNRVKLLLTHLNNMILENSGRKGYGKSYWKTHVMLKYCYFFNIIFNQYDSKELEFDYQKLVDTFDQKVAGIKMRHYPHQRYIISGGKVIIKKGTENTDDTNESYHPKKVFSGGTRIDDYEFILKHIELDFDLNEFGITEASVREDFDEEDVWDAWAEQNYKCKKCKKDITRSDIENDHIISVKYKGKGGKDNLQLLCTDCNRNKSGGMDINDLELIIQKKRGSLTPEQIAAIGEALS